MRRSIVLVIMVFVIVYGCGCNNENIEKPNGIIKIGMKSKEAKKLLMAYNATEALLSIAVPVGSKDRYKSYALSNKPYVVVVYGEKNGREVVRELSLYYEVEHIGHPDNKWLNVEEIDLRNISLDSGR